MKKKTEGKYEKIERALSRINIAKIAILLVEIYKFNTIPNSISIFTVIEIPIFNFIWTKQTKEPGYLKPSLTMK